MSLRGRRYGYESRSHYVRMGVVGLVLISIATIVVFTKPSSLSHKFELGGVFTSANQLRSGSVVRLGGLDIGQVTSIDALPDGTARVGIEISDDDVALHEDARLDIKPRLVLEGNAYVDVRIGSPDRPALADGATIPLARTTVPVQLDQVFGTFTPPVRSSLQDVTAAFATGLGGEPSGAEALRQSVREWDRSLHSIEVTSRAAQGTAVNDLANAVSNTGALTQELATDRRALAGIVTSYATVSGALAARDAALGDSMRELAALLATAPADLRMIDAALPPLARFAHNLQPAIRDAPPALRAADAVLDQIGGIVQPGELPRTLRVLAPVTANLPTVERQLTQLAPKATDMLSCIGHTVVPALKQVAPDGIHTTGDPIWLDALHAGASLAAASPNFDGNGTTIRLGVTESEQAIQGILPGIGQLEGAGEVRGMNPAWLGYNPDIPARPDQPCDQQALPDFGARRTNGPDWLTPVRRTQPADGTRLSLRRLLGLAPWLHQDVAPPETAPQPSGSRRPAQTAPAPTAAPPAPAAATPAPAKDPVKDVATIVDQVLQTALPEGTLPVAGKDLSDILDKLLGPKGAGG